MPASIAAAKAGVTTGEWGAAMREVFGEYRAPTGVGKAASAPAGNLAEVRAAVEAASARLGRRIKFLVGKPGLDGHSNGAEQIAVRARDGGMEVVYEGIRLTPAQIVNAALEESVHVVGLSILSGSHLPLVTEVLERMRAAGLDDIPVVVGGIIPDADAEALRAAGVARVYTPEGLRAEPDHARHRRAGRRRRPRGRLMLRALALALALAGGSAAAQDVRRCWRRRSEPGRPDLLAAQTPPTPRRPARRSASPTSRSRAPPAASASRVGYYAKGPRLRFRRSGDRPLRRRAARSPLPRPTRIEVTTTMPAPGDPRCCPTGTARWSIDRGSLTAERLN